MTRTDQDELGDSDAWQIRLAFTGRDQDARLAAMRKLWAKSKDPLQLEATRAMLARAATLVAPDAGLGNDAPSIISSLLAAGLDEQAANWAPAVAKMNDAAADRCWAMLALGAPTTDGLEISYDRIDKFIERDSSAATSAGRIAGRRARGPRADRCGDGAQIVEPIRVCLGGAKRTGATSSPAPRSAGRAGR